MRKWFHAHKVSLTFFCVSIVVGYTSYWAPFYFNLLSPERLTILGTLKDFEQPCDKQSPEAVCAYRYVVPKNLFPVNETEIYLGLGHVLLALEYGCYDQGKYQAISSSGNVEIPGSHQSSLHTYRTLALDLFKACSENIAIEAWVNRRDLRRGYYGGEFVYGKSDRIETLKRFIEYLLIALPQMLGMMGIAFYLIVRSFSRTIGLTRKQRVFFDLIPYWFLTFIFTSGLVAVLVALETKSRLFVRAGSYFSLLSFFLLASYQAQRLIPGKALARFLDFGSRPLLFREKLGGFNHVFSLASIFILLCVVSPYSSYSFGYLHLVWVAIFFAISIKNFDAMLLSIVYAASVLKIFNFFPFPQSNAVFYYISFYFVYETYLMIKGEMSSILYNLIAKSTHDMKLAKQAAHDIRSPLAVLKLLLSQVEWGQGSDEVRSTVLSALGRVSDISKDVLGTPKSIGVLHSVEVDRMITEILNEKRIQMSVVDVKYNRNLEGKSVQMRLTATEFYRILNNLITNSCQANGVTSVEIACALDANVLDVTISNDGEKIPTSVLEHILEHGGTYGKRDGTGIGLKFSQEAVLKSGGTFKITSEKVTTVELKWVLANE